MLPMTERAPRTPAMRQSFRDFHSRTHTRLLFIYGLTGGLLAAGPDRSIDSLLPLGRFAEHFTDAGELLPRVLFAETVVDSAIGITAATDSFEFATITVIVLASPRNDLTLLLDAELPGEVSSDEISALLATTCFQRAELAVRGVPILDWLREHIGSSGSRLGADLAFGRDVHQMVFPGGALLEQISEAGDDAFDGVHHSVIQMIYRGTVSGRFKVRVPPFLNSPGHTIVAHGRGVSVLAGWAPHVENSMGIVAANLVSALDVLRRIRRNASFALSLNEQAMLESTAQARSLVYRLSEKFNDLQLDLSFGVEAYADSVLIPELLIESFQSSLAEAVSLANGITNSARMLDRLHSMIRARLAVLEAAVQEQEERRAKIFSVIFTVGSLIALPPALLLAFFGTNTTQVSNTPSMFDLSRYWGVYLLAWLPFVALAFIGLILIRRIRTSPPRRNDRYPPSAYVDRGGSAADDGTAFRPADFDRLEVRT